MSPSSLPKYARYSGPGTNYVTYFHFKEIILFPSLYMEYRLFKFII